MYLARFCASFARFCANFARFRIIFARCCASCARVRAIFAHFHAIFQKLRKNVQNLRKNVQNVRKNVQNPQNARKYTKITVFGGLLRRISAQIRRRTDFHTIPLCAPLTGLLQVLRVRAGGGRAPHPDHPLRRGAVR